MNTYVSIYLCHWEHSFYQGQGCFSTDKYAFVPEYFCIGKSVSGQPASPIYIIVGVFICFIVERVRFLGFGDEVVLYFLLP